VNSLFAIFLVLLALGVTLYPLRRAGRVRIPSRAGRVRELEERYRSSLADLQDIELDRDVGNLAEPDYDALRARYRLRAAHALSEINAEAAARTRLEAALGHRVNGHSATLDVPLPAATPSLRRAVLSAALLTSAIVVGTAALYFRLSADQAQQDPLAVLPVAHAHGVTLDQTGGLWVAHHNGLLRSTNGRSWLPSLSNGDFMSMIRFEDGRLLALGHEALWESSDGGVAWAPVQHDLPGADIHGAQLVGSTLYAYAVGFGVFRSSDGAHWQLQAPARAGNVYGLAAMAGTPDALFLVVDDRLIRSLDGGRTWADAAGAGNLALTGAVRAVATDASRGTLYAGTSDGIFQSWTNGAQWNKLAFKSPVMAMGAAGGLVAAVDDRNEFFLSNDGGVTWLHD
jgi:hypothetical protein